MEISSRLVWIVAVERWKAEACQRITGRQRKQRRQRDSEVVFFLMFYVLTVERKKRGSHRNKTFVLLKRERMRETKRSRREKRGKMQQFQSNVDSELRDGHI